MQTEIFLTELEQQLQSEQGVIIADKILSQLAQEKLQVKAIIDRGLDPETYQQQQQYLDALQAAEQVIDQLLSVDKLGINEVPHV